jgi:DNA-binding SARP family transcriptional activator
MSLTRQPPVSLRVNSGSNGPHWTYVRLGLAERPVDILFGVTDPAPSTSSGADESRPRSSQLGYKLPVPYRAVFEFFPSGIIVVDSHGQIQGSNLTAKRMLGVALERDRVRCCDVLDCRRAGTPLADHCITELSLAHEGHMPEVRVDLAYRTGNVSSVWVTGAPYGGAEVSVILQLRPGVVGDRRRRTEPHWMGGPRLRIFTLGRARVESGEGPLAGEWLGHRPGHVLKYLVTHRTRVVPADELIEVFWPSAGPKGTTNVRQAVHTLRDRIEPRRERHTGSAFIAARSGGYELENDAVWVDADDFEISVREGLKALAAAELETAEAALARAVALYRGDFLAEETYAEWAFAERDRLRDLAAQALRGLSEAKVAGGDLEGATEHLLRLAELEPLDMDLQRDLIVMLLRRGRHAEAHRRHEIVRRRYRKAFGAEPSFTLSDLGIETQA